MHLHRNKSEVTCLEIAARERNEGIVQMYFGKLLQSKQLKGELDKFVPEKTPNPQRQEETPNSELQFYTNQATKASQPMLTGDLIHDTFPLNMKP